MRDSRRDTDVQNSLLNSVGEGEGGMIWENGIETCILSYVKRIASPGQMHDTGIRFLKTVMRVPEILKPTLLPEYMQGFCIVTRSIMQQKHTQTDTLIHMKVHAQNPIYPHTVIIICDLSRFLNANSVYSVAKYS